MQRPNVDDDLTLLTGFGKTEAIVVEVLDNPATEEGVLLKVMTRGPFEQGQQVPSHPRELERALTSLGNDRVRTTFAGRTDRGVHAIGQVVATSLARWSRRLRR